MRMFVVLAAVAMVVAIGYVVKTTLVSGTVSPAMIGAAASNTLSPHEIHLNYKGMESLPVHETKDAN
jgi:hypothetical protein